MFPPTPFLFTVRFSNFSFFLACLFFLLSGKVHRTCIIVSTLSPEMSIAVEPPRFKSFKIRVSIVNPNTNVAQSKTFWVQITTPETTVFMTKDLIVQKLSQHFKTTFSAKNLYLTSGDMKLLDNYT